MKQIFEHLKNKNITMIISALRNGLLYGTFDYLNALTSVPKFTKKLFADVYANGNTKALKIIERELSTHINYLSKMSEKNFKKFTIKHNGFFIQLIYYARKKIWQPDKVTGLYTKYLQQIIPDKTHKLYQSYTLEDLLADYLVFVSYDEKFKQNLLIVENKYISQFIFKKNIKDTNWSNVHNIQNGESLKNSNIILEDLFKTFKLFYKPYMFEQNNAKFPKLLTLLNLGEEYHKSFVEALKLKTSYIKYATQEHQYKLNKIFDQLFDSVKDSNGVNTTPTSLVSELARDQLTLTQDHTQKIFIAYEFTGKTNKEKAQLLLLLSGAFAKYSSSSFFGIEDNSPTSLRYYAYGLMKEARALDTTIIPTKYQQDNQDNWGHKLLGVGNAFNCSAMLSEAILGHCRKNFTNQTMFKGIIPPAWE